MLEIMINGELFRAIRAEEDDKIDWPNRKKTVAKMKEFKITQAFTVLAYREIDDMTFAQISRKLGISPGRVGSRYSMARRYLSFNAYGMLKCGFVKPK